MNDARYQQSVFIEKHERLFLLIIIAINFIIKAIPAGILELGNDEVYYWTYALFPDFSHFDHPPMVGLTIQLFTLNLKLNSELFIRMGGLIFSSANIFMLFCLVKRLFSSRAAFFAVFAYLSSFYFNIISGLFILPDTPQIFYVLLALYFILPSITSRNPGRKENNAMLLFGFFTGLAFLSKYHSLFLWFGAGLYILVHNRIWLKKPALYLSIMITLLLMIPVIYWNYKNDFISFTFHGNRVVLTHSGLNFISFMQFNLGQIFYQNPVLFVVFILTLISVFRKIKRGISQTEIILLYISLPLIVVFTIVSLFRSSLPHWTGPAFLGLIILSGSYLDQIAERNKLKARRLISSALILFASILLIGTAEIKSGFIGFKTDSSKSHRGNGDFTLDMYGWRQASEKFAGFLAKNGITQKDYSNTVLVSDNWFPASHIDYYLAHPLNIRLLTLGNLDKIHKYFWINRKRQIKESDKVFFITDSRNYRNPEVINNWFNVMTPLDTLAITRGNKPVKYIFIYGLTGIKSDSFENNSPKLLP